MRSARPNDNDDAGAPKRGADAAEVLVAFLGLGLTSFGGPIAHLGYFRRAFVERRRWITDERYGELLALCQFLPGPTSSQIAFALGVLRAGPLGGLMAWIGFTAPSALLMFAFAYLQPALGTSGVGGDAVHGLKLAAVAVVGQALVSMARSLCPDLPRAATAVAAAAVAAFAPAGLGQTLAIVAGAAAGLALRRAPPALPVGPQGRVGAGPALLAVLFLLLFVPGWLVWREVGPLALFHAFYRAGALVFGGGHVVLPLLRDQMAGAGWVGDDVLLAGYGAAQAMPGPLFSFAAYLGAVASPAPGPAGALVALAAIFLPGVLLVSALLPYAQALSRRSRAAAAVAGANAAVVGVLAVAFYDPVLTSGVGSIGDAVVAALAFALLVFARAPPLLAVGLCVAGAVLMGRAGLTA